MTTDRDFEFGGLKFHGLSLSGVRTSVALPDFGIVFDVGPGYPFALHLKHYFITHGHLDHAAGIPYIISQKTMTRQPPGRFHMPPSLVEPLRRIMKEWADVEKHSYSFDFLPVTADQDIPLTDRHFVRTFPTVHRIESFGYTLFERRRKLDPRWQGLSQEELRQRGRKGEDLGVVSEIPLVSFTGDTRIEFLDQREWVGRSKILLMECTYLDERKSVEHARTWGHLHLDELIPRLPSIQAEKIVLIHLSSRYSDAEANRILQEKLPPEERQRVILFPGR